MESIEKIKKHIKSINSISQITRAMELVAATKMRKVEEIALNSRPYAFLALDLLAAISRLEIKNTPPLLEKRLIQKTAVVVITSDKGLIGSFNGLVLKKLDDFLKKDGIEDKLFVAIGQKAINYLARFGIEKKFKGFGDYTNIEEVKPLADFLISGFLSKKWDRVIVFSMHFRSALKQEVLKREILPISFDSLYQTIQEIIPEQGKFSEFRNQNELLVFQSQLVSKKLDYLIDLNPEIILERLCYHLFLIQIYHLILEANTSEHSARRLAMKKASDNAQNLISKLNIFYNKARQAKITKEIIETVSGVEALKLKN